MAGRILFTGALLAGCLMMVGCSSRLTQPHQYSGFLPDYSRLRETESASGHRLLRWEEPDFRLSYFRGIYLSPLIYYPSVRPTDRVSQQTLDEIRSYATEKIKSSLQQRGGSLENPSGSHVLVAKVAITAVSAENENMKFYEVLPAVAVIRGIMAASGHRSQNATLFLEAELIDRDSGKVVLEVVRKDYGKSLRNDSEPVTADDVKKAIDEMVNDIIMSTG